MAALIESYPYFTQAVDIEDELEGAASLEPLSKGIDHVEYFAQLHVAQSAASVSPRKPFKESFAANDALFERSSTASLLIDVKESRDAPDAILPTSAPGVPMCRCNRVSLYIGQLNV